MPTDQPTFLWNSSPDGLVPAVIQDNRTNVVLMLGYMNAEAYQLTLDTGWVTFYSRSRKELWIKGATSGNKLRLISMKMDCDNDALLVRVDPLGPVCHTGADTCWQQLNSYRIVDQLEHTIAQRKSTPKANSYTSELFKKGINAIAQKVGEEAVELILEASSGREEKFLNEAADLLYHYMVLLQARGLSFADVEDVLKSRMK